MKTVIIGIDSASWDIVDSLIKKGKLPNIQSLLSSGGSFAKMQSTQPPITPASWNSMITGVNPGKHGVIDFVELDRKTLNIVPVSSNSLRVKTLWKILNENGYKVGVVNFPSTYPPYEVDSFFISGFPAPAHGDYAYPARLLEYLKKSDYRIHPKVQFKRDGEKEYFEDVKRLTDLQSQTAIDLMDAEEWDLFFIVFMGLDWIQHTMWDYELSPGVGAVEYFYEYLDEKIGSILGHVQKEDGVIIVSDHGMKEIKGEISTNNLLENWGYLKRKEINQSFRQRIKKMVFSVVDRAPKGIKSKVKKIAPGSIRTRILRSRNPLYNINTMIDWDNTTAFSYGFSGKIYINSKKNYPFGIVNQEEYGWLRDEIIARLRKLSHPDTDEKVIGDIFTKDAVYGSNNTVGPDILFNSRNFDYTVRNVFNKEWIGSTKRKKADHQPDGIFIFKGNENRDVKNCRVEDFAPTVLSLFGIDIPAYMDGKSLLKTGGKISDEILHISKDESQIAFSDVEEDEIKERLEDLGYL